MKKVFLLISVLYIGMHSYAQPGKLDPLFGAKGIVKSDLGTNYSYELLGKQVLLQADGSVYVILVSGGQTLISKKLSNGMADSSYGSNGFSDLAGIVPFSAAFEPDGKILVAGTAATNTGNRFAFVRYNINGSLDVAFGGDGTQLVDFSIASIAIQADGKILAAGSVNDNMNTYFAISRYNINGSPDTSFANNGQQITNFGFSKPLDIEGEYPERDIGYFVAIQADGKIVVAGEVFNYTNYAREIAIARYNTDGSPDNTFDTDGKQTTDFGYDDYGYSVAFQTNGKMIVSGYTSENGSNYDFSIARYNTNGSLDSSFDGDGKQTTNIGSTDPFNNSIAIQKDGKIVVEGVAWNGSNNDFTVVRYNTNGSLDKTFDFDGKIISDFDATDDYANSVAIQKNGKIVVGGYYYIYSDEGIRSGFALARYNANGSLDTSFDGDGKLRENLAQGYTIYSSTAIQKDGKIIAAGYIWNGSNNNFVISRYNTGGGADSSFDKDGRVYTDFGNKDSYANSVVVQSDGKIVVAGDIWNGSDFDFGITRYSTDGSLDKTFDNDGKLITDFGNADNFAKSVVIQSNGKILVAGYSNIGTESNIDFAVARYNADGSLDNTFSSDGKETTDIGSSNDFGYFAAIQADGKILVGGYTNTGTENSVDFALVRYNTNGSLDNAFNGDGKQTTDFGFSDDYANSIAIQSDGKIVAGGRSGSFSAYSLALARYNTNGSPDLSFNDDGKQRTNFGLSDSYANSIAIQNDGKIMTGGGSNENFAIARFNSNGSADSAFSEDGVQITYASEGEDRILNIAIANNKLYAAGYGQYPGYFGVLAKYDLAEISIAPSVSITNPVNNKTYTPSAIIKINALASDADGTVSSVKFYNGTTYLKTVFTSPYTHTLSNLPVGTYSLTAKATDNTGLQTTSAVVKITVAANKAPVVTITSPASNTAYKAPATITITASASDSDGTVSNVKFYNGATYLKTVFTKPYTYTLSNLSAGTYSLTAKAIDNRGLQTISAAVEVVVAALNNAPVVSITSPDGNTAYTAPATLKINAFASDFDGTINNVKFYNGSTYLNTVFASPYTYTLSKLPAGTYSLTAKATDDKGAQSTSAAVQVSVETPGSLIVRNKNASIYQPAELNDKVSLKISPNPVQSILNIYTNGLQDNKRLTLSVISLSGITMITRRSNTSNRSLQLDVSSLAEGVYVIKAVCGDTVVYKQFMKIGGRR